MFKALLLRQKNQAVAQTQDGEGRTRAQPKVLAKLLGDCELSLLSDLRRGQIFESCQTARHKPTLVGISYQHRRAGSNTQKPRADGILDRHVLKTVSFAGMRFLSCCQRRALPHEKDARLTSYTRPVRYGYYWPYMVE